MKKFRSATLHAEMVFSDTVYIDDDTILVQADIPLRQREIDLLNKWGVDEVYTEGDVVRGVVPASATPDISKIQSPGLRFYVTAVSRLDKIFGDLKAGHRVSHDRIDSIVNETITEVERDREGLIPYVLQRGENANKLSANSVNSAILSTLMGRQLKLLSFKLVQLITGALLHDIGMLRIDEGILSKEGGLSSEETKQVRSHPLYGYSTVLKTLRYPEEVAAVALLHQERWDGTGYPRRYRGDQIPLGARVVAVADSCEAMVNRRSYRRPMTSHRAVKAVLSDNGRHFDPKVLKAFLHSVGMFPVGSLVLLNDSSIGRVFSNNGRPPLRPRLELLVDQSGKRLQESLPLDLVDRPDLFVAKDIDASEMQGRAD